MDPLDTVLQAFWHLQVPSTTHTLLLPSSRLYIKATNTLSTPYILLSLVLPLLNLHPLLDISVLLEDRTFIMSSIVSKQATVSMLGSECDQQPKAASLRRTLSADMSSTQWSAQNGFSYSPMKRISSSKGLINKDNESFSPYEEDENPGQDEVWRLIQSQQKEVQSRSSVDIWGSIVSQKANAKEYSTLPPPYVHPLVKRTTSSLSEKSLDICTESLGSETGFNVFSSYAPSETGDAEEDKNETQVTQSKPDQGKELQSFDTEEPRIAKYNFSATKKSPPKSFPPPLPSLAQKDGPSLHMQPHREDGRLVLEAVSIPTLNCFHAHRQDGRLFLRLANSAPAQEEILQEAVVQEAEINEVDEELFNNFDGEENVYLTETEEETDEEGEEDKKEKNVVQQLEIVNRVKELGIVMDQATHHSCRVTSVHRSALVIKNLRGLNNKDPKWTEKFRENVKFVDMGLKLAPMGVEMQTDAKSTTTLSQSLPRQFRVTGLMSSAPVAASFNAYEYFWQKNPAMGSVIKPTAYQNSLLKSIPRENKNQEIILWKENEGDCLVPLVRGCKENKKKSLIFWEPFCIATS